MPGSSRPLGLITLAPVHISSLVSLKLPLGNETWTLSSLNTTTDVKGENAQPACSEWLDNRKLLSAPSKWFTGTNPTASYIEYLQEDFKESVSRRSSSSSSFNSCNSLCFNCGLYLFPQTISQHHVWAQSFNRRLVRETELALSSNQKFRCSGIHASFPHISLPGLFVLSKTSLFVQKLSTSIFHPIFSLILQ